MILNKDRFFSRHARWFPHPQILLKEELWGRYGFTVRIREDNPNNIHEGRVIYSTHCKNNAQKAVAKFKRWFVEMEGK